MRFLKNISPLIYLFYSYLKNISDISSIRISDLHLIYSKSKDSSQAEFIFAKNVKPGHSIKFLDSWVTVTSIRKDIGHGVFAPLTLSGTALINGVLVSNYAHITDHETSHRAFFPLRALYKVFGSTFDFHTKDGVNWYASLLMKISENLGNHSLNFKLTK